MFYTQTSLVKSVHSGQKIRILTGSQERGDWGQNGCGRGWPESNRAPIHKGWVELDVPESIPYRESLMKYPPARPVELNPEFHQLHSLPSYPTNVSKMFWFRAKKKKKKLDMGMYSFSCQQQFPCFSLLLLLNLNQVCLYFVSYPKQNSPASFYLQTKTFKTYMLWVWAWTTWTSAVLGIILYFKVGDERGRTPLKKTRPISSTRKQKTPKEFQTFQSCSLWWSQHFRVKCPADSRQDSVSRPTPQVSSSSKECLLLP